MEFPEILGLCLFGLLWLEVLIFLGARDFSEKAG